jgi:hypothetical protein
MSGSRPAFFRNPPGFALCCRRLAIAAWVLVTGSVLATLLLWGSRGFPEMPLMFARGAGGILALSLIALVYATVGAILAARVHRSAIGWLLLGIGFAAGLVPLINLQIAEALQVLRPAPAQTLVAAWLFSTLTPPVISALLTLLLLVFPDGRPPSRRWWGVALVGITGSLLVTLSAGLDPRGLLWYPALPNPFAMPSSFAPLVDAGRLAGLFLVLGGLTLAAGALAVRYRCAGAVLRRQIRLIVVAALVAAAAMVPLFVCIYWLPVSDQEGERLLVVASIGAVLVPIAVASAVARHHLFGAEAIITRSLLYVPLVAASGGLFVASIAFFQRLFVSTTGTTSDVAVVIATLIAGATFTTVRRALDGFADRRFKPRPPGAQGTGVDARDVPTAAVLAAGDAPAHAEALVRLARMEERLAALEALLAEAPPGRVSAPG